jgi:DNA-binding NarL/FixJ family response regulator
MWAATMNTGLRIGRVLLADDHADILAQTDSVLSGQFEIVGCVSNGVDVIKATSELDPDVVVLDITMPGLDGIEAARLIRRSGSRAKLVFLTVHEDPDYVLAAFLSGGAAYVSKARLASDLVIAIHEVLAQRCFVSPTIVWNLGSGGFNGEAPVGI